MFSDARLLLQSECHPDTCTQMTATEQWIFLCAAHKTPKEVSQRGASFRAHFFMNGFMQYILSPLWRLFLSLCFILLHRQCPAIDYTRHTLDGAACLLNSNKYFPSRSVFMSLCFWPIGGDGNELWMRNWLITFKLTCKQIVASGYKATQLFNCRCDPAYLANFTPIFTLSALFFAVQLLREYDKLG